MEDAFLAQCEWPPCHVLPMAHIAETYLWSKNIMWQRLGHRAPSTVGPQHGCCAGLVTAETVAQTGSSLLFTHEGTCRLVSKWILRRPAIATATHVTARTATTTTTVSQPHARRWCQKNGVPRRRHWQTLEVESSQLFATRWESEAPKCPEVCNCSVKVTWMYGQVVGFDWLGDVGALFHTTCAGVPYFGADSQGSVVDPTKQAVPLKVQVLHGATLSPTCSGGCNCWGQSSCLRKATSRPCYCIGAVKGKDSTSFMRCKVALNLLRDSVLTSQSLTILNLNRPREQDDNAQDQPSSDSS